MEFKTKTIIKELERKIENGYSLKIFKGYVAVNKRGVEKLIDELYATLPEDIKKARNYLLSRNYNFTQTPKENVYKLLQNLEENLEKSFLFAQTVIINIKDTENLLINIQNNLPEEFTKAETLSKS